MENIKEIIELRDQGLSYNEISKKIGCSKSLVAFYCSKNKWEEVCKKQEEQELYEILVCELIKESENINQVCKKLDKRPTNTNYSFIKKIIEKYNIDTSHFISKQINKKAIRYSDEEVFCVNSPYTNSNSLKNRLIKKELKKNMCEVCGNTLWNGVDIPLELHHINGVHNDNRLENLQFLCPNCHATTDNYCGRNKISKKDSDNVIKNNYDDDIALIIKYAKEKCNFTYIGNKIGLTDNGVRKRCKKIGLPYKTNDLKIYIKNLEN